MKKRFYWLLIFGIAVSNLVIAQKREWVTVEGSSHGANITPEEGKKLALDAAREEAIKQVVGLQITEQTYRKLQETIEGNKSKLFDVFGRLSQTNSYGKIVEEKIETEWIEIQNNIPVYKVKLTALVEEELGEADPGFSVEIIMPRDVYYTNGKEGEELDFKIVASRNCYIYLFNILANDSVQVLIPNRFITNNSYYVDRSIQAYEEMLNNFSFNVILPNYLNYTIEALYVVATKDEINFLNGDFDHNSDGKINTYQTALLNIQKWLIKIPRDRRTEAIKQYEIRRGKL